MSGFYFTSLNSASLISVGGNGFLSEEGFDVGFGGCRFLS